MKFNRLLLIVACSMLNLMAYGQRHSSEKQDFNTDIVISGLEQPWGMSFLPDGQLLITEKTGRLKLADLTNGSMLEIKGLPEINAHGQGGLLDVLVHPDFESNRWVYFSYAQNEGSRYGTEVARANLVDNSLVNIETLFIATPKVRGSRHFGSRLAIDRDGFLYISLGDRGDRMLSQQLDSHIGSLIRLHDDGAVPQDNPFVGQDNALAEIYSYGHRNIQGMTIRNSDQSLWTHEHGPKGGDELNHSQAGGNFGWPVITYGVNYGLGTKIGEGTHKDGMIQPNYYWDPSIAPSGMAFYESDKFPSWRNNLFIGSLKFSSLVRLEMSDQEVIHEERLLSDSYGRIRDVEVGPDGLIYLLTDSSNGKLIRLSP